MKFFLKTDTQVMYMSMWIQIHLWLW